MPVAAQLTPAVSHDTLFAGTLRCAQSRQGYRFSIDAVLLAHFVCPHRDDRVLDLGAGCGVISLILAHRYPSLVITCLEVQDSLAALLAQNIVDNGFADRLRLCRGDVREAPSLLRAGAFDLAVCNPPYYRAGSGRQNGNEEQALARHELHTGLDHFVGAAAHALRLKGRLSLIYPAARTAALFAALRQGRLEPKRMQVVSSYPGAEGTLVLLEAIKGGGEGLTVLPPLVIHDRPGGEYSPAVAACYR